MDYGKELRKLREHAGLTVSEFAKIVSISAARLIEFESGNELPELPEYVVMRQVLEHYKK